MRSSREPGAGLRLSALWGQGGGLISSSTLRATPPSG
jgi:hypothetical protein